MSSQIRHPPPYNVTLLAPISDERPLQRGSVVPIRFVVEDMTTGNFVADETVEVLIADEAGEVRVQASAKSTPPVLIDREARQYRLDWHTGEDPEGTYVLSIFFRGASVLHGALFLT